MGKQNRTNEQNAYNQASSAYGLTNAQSQDLLNEGKQYRGTAGEYWTAVSKGGAGAQQTLGPQTSAIRTQYRNAREQLERQAPRGGAVQAGQRQLAMGEAGDVSRLFADRVNESIGQLANLGVFGTQAGLGGALSSAGGYLNTGQSYGALAERQRQAAMEGVKGVASIAGKAAMCSRTFKKDITEFKDYDYALQVILEQTLVGFRYNNGMDDGQRHYGVIVEDTHPPFRNGLFLDVPSVLAYLIGSVKAQQQQIDDLKKFIATELAEPKRLARTA